MLENGFQAVLYEVAHQIFLLHKTFGKFLPCSLMLLGQVDKKGMTCRDSWWLAKATGFCFLNHCLNFPQRKAFFCSSEHSLRSPLLTPAPKRGFFSLREAKLKVEQSSAYLTLGFGRQKAVPALWGQENTPAAEGVEKFSKLFLV